MKKSRNNHKIKAKRRRRKLDSIDVIFQIQKKLLRDYIRDYVQCLESLFRYLGTYAPWKEDFSFVLRSKSETKTVKMAYKFRLSPDEEQKIFLNKHIGCTIFVYNYYLMQRRQYFKDTHEYLDYKYQAAHLTQLKKQPEYIWLKEVNSQSIQQALRNLDTAYKNFYANRARLPKLHSKKRTNSFTVPQFAKIKDGLLWLPKFKSGIPIILHRDIDGEIGRVTISKTPAGDYYASFCVEVERKELTPSRRAVGLDLGIKSLAVTSDGYIYENPKHFKKYARKLAKAQKHLARKKREKVVVNGKEIVKESKSYIKQRIKVAKIHEKIQNCRKDYLHKCALELVRTYEIIGIEDLNIKGMIRNRKLSKAIADASWGTFVTILKYKAKWYGRKVVVTPRFFASSQTCSNCGYINKDVKDLKVRKWFCPQCGKLHDRDLNASLNIKNMALQMLSEQSVNKNHPQ